MRVWRQDMAGENWSGGPYHSDYYQIKNDIYSHQSVALILAIIYLVIGCYHCYLFIRRQNLTDYLAYVMSMMVSLANKVLNFNNVLEIEVAQRTQDLGKATQRLKIIADTDMLTGLLNRQALTERMLPLADKQIDGCFSVLVLDADHFKRLNDTFGTKFGDFVLIELASILAKNIDAKDFIGRWDSQTFVIVLPSIQMAKAEEVAETIRTNVYRFNFELDDSSVSMTVTLGVAASRDDESFEALLDRAGQALYEGKSSGRNKVVCDK
ncbi:MAG: diguanylate cyclase (GGDEF)-like protein [Pseudomonadales bacterium]|jgi:diguanylate cyclase (GGDEF)-like protein